MFLTKIRAHNSCCAKEQGKEIERSCRRCVRRLFILILILLLKIIDFLNNNVIILLLHILISLLKGNTIGKNVFSRL